MRRLPAYGSLWGDRYSQLLALAEAGLPAMLRINWEPLTIEEA